jgi:mono/diheme cytochrome c family protein
MSRLITILLLAGAWILFQSSEKEAAILDENQSLYQTLDQLGYRSVRHLPDLSIEGASAKIGEDLVKFGFSEGEGQKKVKRQSKHFVCTSCHNVEREDPDLSVSDPEARLAYVVKKGLPFLQATSLYGAVNRTEFYNDDYVKKYGELIKPAKNDIREAIQLCAVECAQGRKLHDWEVESILAYLWEIELTLGDLNLDEKEAAIIQKAINGENLAMESIQILESKYLKGSPAHFVEPKIRDKDNSTASGNAQNGKLVYDVSCKHCHLNNRYSYLNLDDSSLTFKWLSNKADTYSRYSIYQIIRYGTFAMHGKSSYMPRYPKEKMSDQQIEDLKAYLDLMAE